MISHKTFFTWLIVLTSALLFGMNGFKLEVSDDRVLDRLEISYGEKSFPQIIKLRSNMSVKVCDKADNCMVIY